MTAPKLEPFHIVIPLANGKSLIDPNHATYNLDKAARMAEACGGMVYQKVGKRFRQRWSHDEVMAIVEPLLAKHRKEPTP